MLTWLVATRFLVDYLWMYKSLSVLHSLVAILVVVRESMSGIVGGVRFPDVNVMLLALLVSLSYFLLTDDGLVDYLKLLAIPLFYFLGRLSSGLCVDYGVVGRLSVVSIFVLVLLALLGYGYQDWGAYSTYTGGYYFKTDLALAVVVFLVFAGAVGFSKGWFYVVFWCLCSYLVVVSNARIALVLMIFVPLMLFVMRRGWLLDFKFIFIFLAGVCLFLILVYAIDLSSLGLLSLDFQNFFDESNLQGRNWIWMAVVRYYSEYGWLEQMIGGGLNSDVLATEKYSLAFGLEDSRAHSSYLYLLVSLGWLGVFLFFSWIFSVIYFALHMYRDQGYSVEPALLIMIATVFFIFSLTAEVVLRGQIMVVLAFLSGRIVLSYYENVVFYGRKSE